MDKPYRVVAYTLVLVVVWTGLIVASLHHLTKEVNDEVLNISRAMADTALDKDMLYRRWNARNGGVYVPASELTRPNPNLAHVPERDVVTPSGRKLTLVNPAYMTRQVFEYARNFDGAQGHITSLKPIYPDNSPDVWEADALRQFERGAGEISAVDYVDGAPFMRVIRPFVVEEQCLKCHAEQGYHVGDVRGGISVSIPMSRMKGASKNPIFTESSSLG